MAVILETSRLVLRTWGEADKLPFSVMNSDPDVMEFLPKRLSREESDALASSIERHIAERGYGLWAAELKETREFMGFIGFKYTDFPSDFTPCVEIGWRLHKNFWGKGYATEGAKECLKYGFASLGFDKVRSFTSVLNVRSINVMEKIGLTKIKNFDHPKLDASDRLRHHVLYGLSRDDRQRTPR